MTISSRELSAFSAHLRQEDRSSGTAGKYLHDCTGFALCCISISGFGIGLGTGR